MIRDTLWLRKKRVKEAHNAIAAALSELARVSVTAPYFNERAWWALGYLHRLAKVAPRWPALVQIPEGFEPEPRFLHRLTEPIDEGGR